MSIPNFIGSPAPDFSLLDHTGRSVTLADYKGKQPVVLIFYPGDDTPGCTKQLCAVRDDAAEFKKLGVAVFGVNPGKAESHTKFVTKHNLTTPLLIDQGLKVTNVYGATKKLFKTELINRTVVLIDKQGVIRSYWHGMPEDSVILAAVKALG